MNRVSTAPNDSAADQRQPRTAEQSSDFRSAASGRGVITLPRSAQIRPPTTAAILAFWLFWFLAYTAYSFINMPERAASLLLPRSLIAASGAVISLVIAAILHRYRERKLSTRALVAIASAVVGTVVHTVITQQIWVFVFPYEPTTSSVWVTYAADMVVRFWFFASVSAIILALSYVDDVQEREERISALQALAHDAQLRALRHQLNPHFLFNALNSIAGLMSRNRGGEAETMIENLADFLRATLALDPRRLITLAEEVKLEELYLDIEKVRFPERLNVTIDIPDELKEVLVPSLITQPLIENSMRYAVARSTDAVALRVYAEAVGDRHFSLVIEDSGGGDADVVETKGSNVGITNVAERLAVHFGDAANIQCISIDGGFRNMLVIPIRRQ